MVWKIFLLVWLLIFVPPAIFGVWWGETWMWRTIPGNWRWIWLWAQVVVAGAMLGAVGYIKGLLPLLKRLNEKKRQADLRKQQGDYERLAGSSCLYLTAAGSISKVIWSGFARFLHAMQEQRLKIYLNVPSEDEYAARAELERSLKLAACLDPPPVRLRAVASGHTMNSGADAARDAEEKAVSADFSTWETKALPKARLVLQFVGMPSAGKEGRKGFTSQTCFRWAFVALRRTVGTGGGHAVGDVARWVVLVQDMEVDEGDDGAAGEATTDLDAAHAVTVGPEDGLPLEAEAMPAGEDELAFSGEGVR
ncbi:MAG: hypothetical protein HY671_04155 [Chloroflexi bacterium]|nr:hypothetical protein [Chloroflexota bacterium]